MSVAVIYAIFTLVESNVSLYKRTKNEFSGLKGYVLYGKSFINGSSWNYTKAIMLCKELGKTIRAIHYSLNVKNYSGFQGVASFKKSNHSVKVDWQTVVSLQCSGNVKKISDCTVNHNISIPQNTLAIVAEASCSGLLDKAIPNCYYLKYN